MYKKINRIMKKELKLVEVNYELLQPALMIMEEHPAKNSRLKQKLKRALLALHLVR